MLVRIVLGVVVGVFVWLICLLVGGLLGDLEASFAVTVGDWLHRYASIFGLLAAIWYALGGAAWFKKKA